MSNSITGLAILLLILGLLVGGSLTYAFIPRTVEKVVEKEVLVDKEVPVETIVEVEKIVTTDYKQNVVDALLAEVNADKALRKCGGVKYDVEEISVKKVYDGFTVTEDSDGDLSVSDVGIKLNYDDGKCYRTLTCGLDIEGELAC